MTTSKQIESATPGALDERANVSEPVCPTRDGATLSLATSPAVRSMVAVDPVDDCEAEIGYLDALGRHLSAEVQRDIYKFAVRACYGLQRCGVRVDPDLAKNLVADAISDTANGSRRWRPDRCSLVQHLRGVVRSRASIMAEHNRRFPRVEVANDDDERGAVAVSDPGSAPELSVMRDLARRVLSPLYEAANDNDDPHVVRVLDAYCLGITKRAEVAKQARMTTKDFDRARDRLSRLVTRLPKDLRSALADMLGRRQ